MLSCCQEGLCCHVVRRACCVARRPCIVMLSGGLLLSCCQEGLCCHVVRRVCVVMLSGGLVVLPGGLVLSCCQEGLCCHVVRRACVVMFACAVCQQEEGVYLEACLVALEQRTSVFGLEKLGRVLLFQIKSECIVDFNKRDVCCVRKERLCCCVWRSGCVLSCLCSEGVCCVSRRRELFHCPKERGRGLPCYRIKV